MNGGLQPYIVPPGGTRLENAILPFKALAADTGGLISICEFHLGRWESGPVLHAHDATDEGFFVIEGSWKRT